LNPSVPASYSSEGRTYNSIIKQMQEALAAALESIGSYNSEGREEEGVPGEGHRSGAGLQSTINL
jgi:hypothetical protein